MIVHDQKDGIFVTAFCELNEVLKIFHKYFIYPPLFAAHPAEPIGTPANINSFTKQDLGKIKFCLH